MLTKAKNILQTYYGYSEFRQGQANIIASLSAGRDSLAIMPTGAGKSLCFQIPALLFSGLTIVISPLISLMKDQVDALNSLGIPAAFINSSLTGRETNERINAARSGRYKLLYIAPERLESESFQQTAAVLPISFLAIDEAHCISQWGHDFRPSYRTIAPFIHSLPKRPVIGAFTATATQSVQRDIVSLLALQNPNCTVTGFDRKNLSFTVLRGENKKNFVLGYLEQNKNSSGIIYAATRKDVDALYELLCKHGYAAGRYHAGLSDEERAAGQEKFIYDDNPVMVATNAFGMGIDKSNVRYVIHYNMPKNMEAYYQEAGRAGRDGQPGECILLFSPQDTLTQKFFIEQSVVSAERKSNEFAKLQDMVDYCHTPRCLRAYILQYFGETGAPAECGNCSTCNDDSERVDITIDAQKIFSCILRMKERFGLTLVADVLKGAKNKKVLDCGFQTLSTYGLLANYHLQDLKDLINMLIAEEYLTLTEGQYPVIKLAAKAYAVLKSQATVWHKVRKQRVRQAADNTLFELLRKVRRAIAERERIPPYIVFADSTLKEMSEYLPTDSASLRTLKGVGDVKLDKYGDEFLAVIRQYAADNPRQSALAPNAPRPAAFPGKTAAANSGEQPSHLITLELYNDGKSLPEIAVQRQLSIGTLQDHLLRCHTEGFRFNWDPLIPPRQEELILAKIRELGAQKLKPLKDALPDAVTYNTIRAVICKHNS